MINAHHYSFNSSELFRNLGWAVLSLLALAGCAVGPNFKPPATQVPDSYYSLAKTKAAPASQVTPDPAALMRWWRNFHDPILDSLVQLALAGNLDLKQAEARIRQARAARGIAVAGVFPQFNSSALYERSHSSSQTVGPGGGTSVSTLAPFQELFQAGLDASWELDVFGGTRRNT